jgi:hypothetical protein
MKLEQGKGVLAIARMIRVSAVGKQPRVVTKQQVRAIDWGEGEGGGKETRA